MDVPQPPGLAATLPSQHLNPTGPEVHAVAQADSADTDLQAFMDDALADIGACRTWEAPAANRPQRSIFHPLLVP